MAEHGVLCIQALPSGLLHGIFSVLSPRDLCAVSATCKHWRQLNQDDAANQVRHAHCPFILLVQAVSKPLSVCSQVSRRQVALSTDLSAAQHSPKGVSALKGQTVRKLRA